MAQAAKPTRWENFVSLTWYDSAISFLFRFVAKTAEPLLAAGVIVSAADFLQHGRLMRGNMGLENTWAWTQALAIEASTGPVLVFALQAWRSQDNIKGWLYAVLAGLLFFVGGSMLLLQLISSVSGLDEANINTWVLYGLFLLRVIVSGGMVALSCTKHLRFSGNEKTIETATLSAMNNDTLDIIATEQEHLNTRLDTLQTMIEHPKEVKTSGLNSVQLIPTGEQFAENWPPSLNTQVEQSSGVQFTLIEHPVEHVQVPPGSPVNTDPLEQPMTAVSQPVNKATPRTKKTPVKKRTLVVVEDITPEQRVRMAYAEHDPDVSDRQLAKAARVSPATAGKWRDVIEQEKPSPVARVSR